MKKTPQEILAEIKTHIAALAEDPKLTPLLGVALTNLRGAANCLEGHIKSASAKTEAAAPPK